MQRFNAALPTYNRVRNLLLCYAFIPLSVMGLVLMANSVYRDYGDYRDLSAKGVEAWAMVNYVAEDIVKPMHRRKPVVSYSFAAHDGASHTVKSEISPDQAQALRAGQILRVIYVPERPATSAVSADNAWQRFRNDGLATGFFAIFLILLTYTMRAEFRFGGADQWPVV